MIFGREVCCIGVPKSWKFEGNRLRNKNFNWVELYCDFDPENAFFLTESNALYKSSKEKAIPLCSISSYLSLSMKQGCLETMKVLIFIFNSSDLVICL